MNCITRVSHPQGVRDKLKTITTDTIVNRPRMTIDCKTFLSEKSAPPRRLRPIMRRSATGNKTDVQGQSQLIYEEEPTPEHLHEARAPPTVDEQTAHSGLMAAYRMSDQSALGQRRQQQTRPAEPN